MKAKKFNALLISAMACTALLATSCKDEEEKEPGSSPVSTITASVGDIDVDTVKVLVWFEEEGNMVVLQSAPYANGGFSMTLPGSVDAKYLESMFEEGRMMSLNISNRSVKAAWADIYGYNSEVGGGSFYYEKRVGQGEEEEVVVYADLVYVDGDVVVTGTEARREEEGDRTYSWTTTYSVSLKKGWNFLYETGTEEVSPDGKTKTYTSSYTTSNPGGLKWYYQPKGYYGAPKAAASAFKPFKVKR